MQNIDDDLRHEIISAASFYERRLCTGSKEIFHLEAFVAKFVSDPPPPAALLSPPPSPRRPQMSEYKRYLTNMFL